MILILLYALMAQSWNVVAGLSGQISLGQAIFFGIGAYSSTVLFAKYGITPWAGLMVGMLLSALAAVAIGVPTLRLRGHYFAIATLLIGSSVQIVFQRWDWVGAASGLYVPIERASPWFYLQFHTSKVPYYYLALGWAIGLGCVGIAGSMLSSFYYIFPEVGVNFALLAFVAVALGGFGSILGSLLAGVLIGLVESLGGLLLDPSYKTLIVFGLYLGVVIVRPNGLFGRF